MKHTDNTPTIQLLKTYTYYVTTVPIRVQSRAFQSSRGIPVKFRRNSAILHYLKQLFLVSYKKKQLKLPKTASKAVNCHFDSFSNRIASLLSAESQLPTGTTPGELRNGAKTEA